MSRLESNKAVAKNFIEAMGRLDVETFLGLLTEDVVFETTGEWPASGVKTKAQVAREFPALAEILPKGLRFTIISMTAEDDRVHAETAGESETFDGGQYNNRYHYAFEIRDGKVSVFREYMDSDLAMRVLVPALARHGALKSDREAEAMTVPES